MDLTAFLFAGGVLALLSSLPLSVVVVGWYRYRIGKNAAASGQSTIAPRHDPRDAARPLFQGVQEVALRGSQARLRARVAVVYVLAGAAWSAVMTWLLVRPWPTPPTISQICFVGYAYLWPLVLALPVLLALPSRWVGFFAVLYCAIGVATNLLGGLFLNLVLQDPDSPMSNVSRWMGYLQNQAWYLFPVLLITGLRRLRPVLPVVLAGMLVFSFSAIVAIVAFLYAFDVRALPSLMPNFSSFAELRATLFVCWLVASLPAGLVCWLLLHGLARGYRAKSFSDVQLVVDAWWLIVTFDVCAQLATDLKWGALYGFLAFAAYRIMVAAGLRGLRVSPADAVPARLLLLRVFGFQKRTERLFDGVGERWRLFGNVNVIASADLAGRTIDPGEIVSLAGGSVHSLFIADGADLERRLVELDERRDPDGRFRINDFYCYDHTWRPTLESLLGRSDVVLVDLRSFTKKNTGLLFELAKLVEHGKLARTLFVVDDDRDVELLRATLAQASASAELQSSLRLARVRRQSGAELAQVYASLQSLAAPA